jgi:hypothetical protein
MQTPIKVMRPQYRKDNRIARLLEKKGSDDGTDKITAQTEIFV